MTPGDSDPHTYHFDLRPKATAGGSTPADGAEVLEGLIRDRSRANPVSVLQFGLGALQLGDRGWLGLVDRTVDWVEGELDTAGLLAYRFPMPHTFPLDPPWYSSLAQGEAGSLLVRAAEVLKRPGLLATAAAAISPLLDPSSRLIVQTPQGPVLEEYPTAHPSFVLNGWITSLWGLHDVARSPVNAEIAVAAATAFTTGADTVAARIGLYRVALGWTRYDLYPHPLINVASPAYHSLHISHLRTLHGMVPRDEFAAAIADWERAAANPVARTLALSRKAAFRVARPRTRRIRPVKR